MLNEKAITIWYNDFTNVPREIMDVIKNQDDIDNIAFVPDSVDGENIPPYLDSDLFGCCSINIYQHPQGQVYVGYHA